MSPRLAPSPIALCAEPWPGHEVLDTGDGRKLERYAAVTVVRPEPQCFWRPCLPASAWDGADAVFEATDEEEAGRWRLASTAPQAWPMAWRDVRFVARFTTFRHLAVFPEHAANWAWISEQTKRAAPGMKVLNLFGYTGVASLAAARCGASVTHVDASRRAVAWARENAVACDFVDAPVRWLCEDARKWVGREVRRGARYDGVILDPPKFGRGPGGEAWRLNEHLPQLVRGCADLLAEDAKFLLLNAYSERLTGLALAQLVAEALHDRPGSIDWGELVLTPDRAGRSVGVSFFARWAAP